MTVKLETLKRRVHKFKPEAQSIEDNNGDFFIRSKDKKNLMVEQFLPHQDTEYLAWYEMWQCLRTQQNIKRTSPLKSIFYENGEKRKMRISKRIHKK